MLFSKNWQFDFFYPERSEKLHAMLINCGHEFVKDTSYRWHGLKRGSREMAIWQYTVSGFGALEMDGVVHHVHPGQAMVLQVPENHCYFYPEESTGWEFIYVTVGGSELARLLGDFRHKCGFLCDFATDSATVGNARELLERAKAKTLDNRYLASTAAYQFVMSLLSDAPAAAGNPEVAAMQRKVHAYAISHLDGDCTVEKLARAAGYSRWHFSRLFREAEGRPPGEFILELRLRRALRLLQTSTKTSKEIALECGFDDPGYFCKVFRKFHGISPGKFRSGEKTSKEPY